MNKLALLNIGFLSFCLTAAGQVDCVKHWSANKSQIIELDAILSEFEWQPVDTVYCDSFLDNEPFKYTWYIDFYNKQFGNYFSNARNISFAMFHFRLRNDSVTEEINVTQFVLPQKDADRLKAKYGVLSREAKTFRIEALIFYKYVIKYNVVYYIATESPRQAKNHDSLFEQLFSQIVLR